MSGPQILPHVHCLAARPRTRVAQTIEALQLISGPQALLDVQALSRSYGIGTRVPKYQHGYYPVCSCKVR